MANTLRIKRRAAGLAAGGPESLENAELAFNEQDDTLYYGEGTGGEGGTAGQVIAIAGSGAFTTLNTTQTLSGNKTFSGLVIVPAPSANTHATTKLYVDTAINGISTFTVAGDSGANQTITNGVDTLTISGGTAITSVAGSTDTVTLNLDNTAVVAGTYGSASLIPTFTVDAQGRLTSAGTESIATVLNLNGDTGEVAISLLTEELNILGGTGLTSVAAPSTDTLTINLDNTSVASGSYGSASQVGTFTVDAQGRLTAASNSSVTIVSSAVTDFAEAVADTVGAMVSSNTESGISVTYDDSDNTLDFDVDDFTITLNGDVAGVGTVTNLGNVTISTTVQANSVSLGDDTTGDYVATITAGTGVSTTASTSGEGTNHTLSIGQDVGTSSNVTFADINASGNLTISGDFFVNGTTTTINSTTLTVDDKNIELGSITSPTDAAADGGGITLKGTTDKTFNWVDATNSWTPSENLNVLSGKVIKIAGTEVLGSTVLGSTIVTSSLTSVGTITSGAWNGSTISISHGGTGATTAPNARINLGLEIGVDVQGYDVELAAIAGLTSSADKLPFFTGSGTAALATLTSYARDIIASVDASAARTTLGLGTIAVQNSNSVTITGGSITNLATFDGVTIDCGTF